ncbi:MAG: TIGR01906 family membrane protein [Gudongella sp.]|jgi:integral membrane protein (TIGR01906 family)|nr:TIGR01906 family membrane protein [Gudongella sp.]
MKNRILAILTVVAVSLFSLVMALERNTYNLNYYNESFVENGVLSVTSKTEEELEIVARDIIDYLKGKDDSLLNEHFNEREISHMEDVLGLFNIARAIKFSSFLIILFSVIYFMLKNNTKLLGRYMIKGLLINYAVILILAILVVTNFSKYFVHFHEIFFNNDLWILDPAKDLLIQMLPEPFFVNIAKKTGFDFIRYILLSQFIGYILFRKGHYGVPNVKFKRM